MNDQKDNDVIDFSHYLEKPNPESNEVSGISTEIEPEPTHPKGLSGLLIRISGGLIATEAGAKYVMIAVITILLIISGVVLFGKDLIQTPKDIPDPKIFPNLKR